MVLEAETTIVQSKGAHTQYIVIPSVMVQDSQYPFKAGDKVKIVISTHQTLTIKLTDGTEAKASHDSANMRRKK